jgi:hypothetical protein
MGGSRKNSRIGGILALLPFVALVGALWPLPVSYSSGNSAVVLSPTFRIEFSPPPDGPSCVSATSKILSAIDRTLALLHDDFIPAALYPFQRNFEPPWTAIAVAPQLEVVIITQKYEVRDVD